MIEFKPFQKIPRLKRDCIITEKIDGTNASIWIGHPDEESVTSDYLLAAKDGLGMFASSRKQWIKPGKQDNMGFALWAKEHADDLFQLGEGHFFGEWWGGKIQRGYGVGKQFSLFHNHGIEHLPSCVSVVPTLYTGPFTDAAVDAALNTLRTHGSFAAPGYMHPEGIVVYLLASRQLYKVTLDNDGQPKGVVSEKIATGA